MGFTYDTTTDAGKVRLLCTDTSSAEQIFDDSEISAFLTLEGDVRRAAALALETLASSENRIQKAIRISNLQTNGPAVAAEFRERAKALRDQAVEADARDGTAFDWAEYAFDPFSERELWLNQALREQS